MIKEFCYLSHVDEEGIQTQWTDVANRLLKYAPLEDKKSVKNLLVQLESSNEGTQCSLHNMQISKILLDRETAYVILILSAILSRVQKKKGSLLTVFEVLCFLTFRYFMKSFYRGNLLILVQQYNLFN